jgi:soluble lytic murein transglycosylase
MWAYREFILTALLVLAAPPCFCTQAAQDPAAVRQEFLAAMQRIRLHQPDIPDSQALESYAIHDYLVAARLRRDLSLGSSDNLDATIDTFLQTRSNQPVTRTLRRDWLVSLAQRRRWDLYLLRSADVVDPVLICDRLQGRLAVGDTAGLGPAALLRWMLPQRPPAECADVFAWLHQQGLVTPALAEARARAALAADNPRLAREFAAEVPINQRAALLQWTDLLEFPKSALNVLATHPLLTVEPEALAAGFEKLARTDVAAAWEILPRLLERGGLNLALQTQLRRSAALGAAYAHDPRAVRAFDDLPLDTADSQALEWRVRAALWAGAYAKTVAWIDQMPANLGVQPRWRYWRARAIAETMGAEAAAPFFGEIAGLRDYYGYLAADRLHRDYSLNMHASPVNAATQAALAADAGMVRAHELFDDEMTDDAGAEWSAVLNGADNALKVQAALLAAHWNWYAQSIATLAQTAEFDDVILRYPRPYTDAVNDAARFTQLPPDWILAVMRQESLFRKDAVSRADARGLMQMLPGTASAVARRWHISPPAHDGLFDPAIAIPLGAAYLRELLDHYHGQVALALAAYNAGPAAVARWLPLQTMDAEIWIENIPYNETRGYVAHILEHMVAFAAVRGAEPARLETVLSAVEPPQPTL